MNLPTPNHLPMPSKHLNKLMLLMGKNGNVCTTQICGWELMVQACHQICKQSGAVERFRGRDDSQNSNVDLQSRLETERQQLKLWDDAPPLCPSGDGPVVLGLLIILSRDILILQS